MCDKKIKILKNGPYLVNGNIPLDEKEIAINEEGYYYKEIKNYEVKKSYSLCRCGKSKTKPFCDGEHEKIGFLGNTINTNFRFEENVKIYNNKNLVLKDNEKLCAFARFCHTPYEDIWELMSKDMSKKDEELAVKLSTECPAGRLVIMDKKTGEDIEPALEKGITIINDPMRNCEGSIWVKGGIPIEDENGNTYETRNRVALCRCGKSSIKPFCDSSHVSD